jgi:predicted alpha/beta hydrolase family esterase
MKRVYLIHGWEGSPEDNWLPWLKSKLEENSFKVFTPFMPETYKPVRSQWLKTMQDLISNPDENTYFVGHSLGCQAIQRYLESLEGNVVTGGAVFVAGWINDPMWDDRTEEETKIVHDWFDIPKDYEKIKLHCKKFISIFSSDDPFISKSNWEEAKNIIGSEVRLFDNRGHFDGKELQEALDAVLEITK